jgi:hypothetical protein
VPAMIAGICLGPIAANFLNAADWGLKEKGQVSEITLVSLLLATVPSDNSPRCEGAVQVS